jgi:hypothetical protein
MNTTSRNLVIALLFACCAGVSQAQEGGTADAFLSDGRPALLFQADQLSLSTWNGGIGMTFSSNDVLHWRFAFHPRFVNRVQDFTDSSGTTRAEETGRYGLGLSIAPFWVLSKSDAFFLTVGVSGFYQYSSESSIQRKNRSAIPYSARNTTYQNFSAGGNLGVGWAISPSIVLHGEYHLTAEGVIENNEERYGKEFGLLGRLEWMRDNYTLAYRAMLSLLVRI